MKLERDEGSYNISFRVHSIRISTNFRATPIINNQCGLQQCTLNKAKTTLDYGMHSIL